MIEPLLRRLIEHEKRKQAVIILSVVTGLVAIWPAADVYIAANARLKDTRAKLAECEQEVAKLSQYTELFQRKQDELDGLERRMVSAKAAQGLRNELVQLVRQTGCTMRVIRLGDPTRRDWLTQDDAVQGTRLVDRGEETPFQLVTRQLSLSITGPMANIYQFLSRMYELDRMIHTKNIAVRRSDGDDSAGSLDMDVWLFDLVLKAES